MTDIDTLPEDHEPVEATPEEVKQGEMLDTLEPTDLADGEEEVAGSEEVENDEEESGKDQNVEEIEEIEENEEELVYDSTDETNQLRQLLREQKKEIALLRSQGARLAKGQKALREQAKEVDYLDGEEPKEIEAPELSRIEELQNSIQVIGTERAGTLDLMLDLMEDSSRYNDVKEVCSQANFGDIFETIAQGISEKENRSFDEVVLEVEAEVWKLPNPYKYMYGLIKEHHPNYMQKVSVQKQAAKKVKAPVETPPTVVTVAGGGDKNSGWSTKKIDSMPEIELTKVPKEVYDKYLQGTLD